MDKEQFREKINRWGQDRVPFLFITDFELKKLEAFPLDRVDNQALKFSINGFSNCENDPVDPLEIGFQKFLIEKSDYESKFNKVMYHLNYGDSYLTNLTIKTKIELSCSLLDIFYRSSAKYRLWLEDKMVVFSPETFIRVSNNKIFSYPMKGTIDASIPNAEEILLASKKEKSEHVTIVDLIRNDLSQIASNVRVEKFRYVEKIKTNDKNLLQVSSEIVGNLPSNYLGNLGDILLSLLPAGSISGAPKQKTVEIIQQIEDEERGYYTGVFGYFDGNVLDSGVMIRYIEREENNLFYRSGGGITTQSDLSYEYKEAIDKVYLSI